MNLIAFVDAEIDSKSGKILDIGSVKDDGSFFHNTSVEDFTRFLSGVHFLCGHNIIKHDLKYLRQSFKSASVLTENIIDTLYLSPLLFPTKPYHALVKDYKLQTEEFNNPLTDSIKARDLLHDEITAFRKCDPIMKKIYFLLLEDKQEFGPFFRYINYCPEIEDPEPLIRTTFKNNICSNLDISYIIRDKPIELAYSLSLIFSFIHHKKVHSITPPWVLKNYPEVERIMMRLRNKPCLEGCGYCNQALDIHQGLFRFFGFDSYRTYGGEALQEKAVTAAVAGKSILSVFPTGGGKSITFQVPALMSAESMKGLTVIISPLQSLMKDQVDNLERAGITEAVTISGLLDPIERAKSIERIEDGSASILYISPESLRSRTIEKLILGRKISRFVIDEAHCFSSWGQDFRVDYLYIGDFIKTIQELKNLADGIPVSCFTATAKQKVIEDIRSYFNEKLGLELELFASKASRTNLQYKVFEKGEEEEKYQTVRDLIEEKNCPTIIYVSRTRKAYLLATRLAKDGYNAKPYHGKMEKQEKSQNQDSFINGETQVMVATSAFGMGVDKKDIRMVIHYEISDSLENYVQEAGRAGRDEQIVADCFVLFDEEDLSKHFILLNQTKLSIKEIQQIWKAIKDITRFRSSVSNSALEIARKAGWDDNVVEIETRVTTAIAALEDAGYLKRGQNMPRIFANSILAKNAQEAIDRINGSERFGEKQKEKGIRIIKKLFSSKHKYQSEEDPAESRVDYISDHLGIVREEVINIVNLFREEGILSDAKDLSAFIKKGENKNRLIQFVEGFAKIEKNLLSAIEEPEMTYHLKELNEKAEAAGCEDCSISRIKTVLNFWAIKDWIRQQNSPYSKNHIAILCLHTKAKLVEKLEKRHELARFIIGLLNDRSHLIPQEEGKQEVLVEFSVHELKIAYENSPSLFKLDIDLADIEDTLFYLSRIEAIKIEGGFLVVYNRLTIERIEQDNKKKYTKDDYQKLNQFYESKVQQIHIVGEYAKKMINDYKDALQFVDDYFQLNYSLFLRKYFPGSRADQLQLKMTPGKFRQLFGELSPTQLKIINDNETKYLVVAAGPGSGKTKVLVHKLASLLLMEDVKHEQLLMLTFSRAAATEFKKRLLKLIGNAANYIEIKTFHSFCFDLLGRVGNLEKSELILKKTTEKIRNMEVEPSRITKTVLVIDEAQDMSADEFELIRVLMDQNEEMRVIAVGDDDQNIFEFRGSSSNYLEKLIHEEKAVKHELVENFRSKSNLVDFTNQFASQIRHRLKNTPVIARQADLGNIHIIQYDGGNLVSPIVRDILETGLTGSTCVLTRNNEEALQIAGMLLKNKLPVRLIQTNEGFNLYNLMEVRFFLEQLHLTEEVYTISDEAWNSGKQALSSVLGKSSKYELCLNLIKDFETIYPNKKFKSDLEIFIRESKLEDFFTENGELIYVSTIHKAKGREFDNVFMMIRNIFPEKDEEKRLLYVGMTRAKQHLRIHLNTDCLQSISVDNLKLIRDTQTHLPPDQLAVQLGYKDIWLDFFIKRQWLVGQLISGEKLRVIEAGMVNAKGDIVTKFSKDFMEKINKYKDKGYCPSSGCVNFIVYWLKEGANQEVKVVLPELIFQRNEA
jgi:ATP-dependent DNA helicase RecQ